MPKLGYSRALLETTAHSWAGQTIPPTSSAVPQDTFLPGVRGKGKGKGGYYQGVAPLQYTSQVIKTRPINHHYLNSDSSSGTEMQFNHSPLAKAWVDRWPLLRSQPTRETRMLYRKACPISPPTIQLI